MWAFFASSVKLNSLPESEHLGLWAGFLWGAAILLALTAAWDRWHGRRVTPERLDASAE